MGKQKYFTEEEKRLAINKNAEARRRKKGILPRTKFDTETERILRKKEQQRIYLEEHKEETKQKRKIYWAEHKKELKEKRKIYLEEHKEEIKAYKKKYREEHKEEIKIYDKKYNQENKEAKKKQGHIYRQVHKKRISEKRKLKLANDINYKLSRQLRIRLWGALHRNQKSGSAVRDLGCSIEELKIYLESKFQEGMSWKNWGRYGWHIDHIKPLASFNLQNREEFLKAVHYTNLQPLWAEDNYKKGSKL